MKSFESNMDVIEQEISELHKNGFLLPNESIKDISGSIYDSSIWAEVFWRRKESHESRDDPEIRFVFESDPEKILDIGSAYGRVLKKLVQEKQKYGSNAAIHGIELCQEFESYYKKYVRENESLREVKMMYGDFLTTKKIEKESYNVILLSMNTLPNIPVKEVEKWFNRVHDMLVDGGFWIFTTHKYRPSIINTGKEFSGDILVKCGEGPIINETFSFNVKKAYHGSTLVSYSRYSKLSRDHHLESSYLYKSTIEFFSLPFLDEIARKNSFKTVIRDDSSHSLVHVMQKMEQ